MLIISFLAAALICIVVPILVGDLLLPGAGINNRYIMGMFGSLAIAQLLFLPFVYYQHNYTPYFWAFVVLIGGLCLFSIIKNHSHYLTGIVSCFSPVRIKENINIWMIMAVCIIGLQVVRVAIGHFFVYADNSLYIPSINDLLETDKDAYLFYQTGEPGFRETDRKYLFTTYFPYLASVCKLSGIHPAILVQTILPIILTIVSYALVWDYGFFLFKERKAAWIFVFFFGVLVETIGGYDHTYANSVITGIYFGKKIVFTILLPFLLLFIAKRTSLLEDDAVALGKTDVLRLFLMMLGICAPSLMGTGLAPIVLFCIGIVLVIRTRSALPMLQMIIGMIPTIVMLLVVINYLFFRT